MSDIPLHFKQARADAKRSLRSRLADAKIKAAHTSAKRKEAQQAYAEAVAADNRMALEERRLEAQRAALRLPQDMAVRFLEARPTPDDVASLTRRNMIQRVEAWETAPTVRTTHLGDQVLSELRKWDTAAPEPGA